jgi:hypothetical protein
LVVTDLQIAPRSASYRERSKKGHSHCGLLYFWHVRNPTCLPLPMG